MTAAALVAADEVLPLRELEAASVRAVVFDLNGVLTLPPAPDAARRLRGLAELDGETFERLYWRYRAAYDRDEIDTSTYWRRIGRDGGRRYEDERVRELVQADAATWARPNRPLVDALLALAAAGMRTAILSNTPRDVWARVSARNRWTRIPDVHTLSFAVGTAKPDPAVFGICLEQLRVEPAETFLLDDREENVTAAQLLGIRARRYTHDGRVPPQPPTQDQRSSRRL